MKKILFLVLFFLFPSVGNAQTWFAIDYNTGGWNGALMRSLDEGQTWTAVVGADTVDYAYIKDVCVSDDGTKAFYIRSNGKLYFSEDSGTNWTYRNDTLGANSFIDCSGNLSVIVKKNGNLYSNDYGVTFTALSGTTNTAYFSAHVTGDGTKVYLGESGVGQQILVSENGGSYSLVPGSSGGEYFGMGISRDFQYSVVSYSYFILRKSNLYGSGYTNISGLTSAQGCGFDDGEAFLNLSGDGKYQYVSCSYSTDIWRSEDYGETFTSMYSSAPGNIGWTPTSLDYTGKNVLQYVGGIGLRYSTNYGQTWSTIPGSTNWFYQNAISSGYTGDIITPNVGNADTFYYDSSGNICEAKQFYTESGSYVDAGFASVLFDVDYTGALVVDGGSNQVYWNGYSNSGTNWDYFSAVNVETGGFYPTELTATGFSSLNSGYFSRINEKGFSVFEENSDMRLSFRSVRNLLPQEINYVKFKVSDSFGTGTKVGSVLFINELLKDTQPLIVVETGIALATAQPKFKAKNIVTIKDFKYLEFSGFEMGLLQDSVDTKYQCKNDDWNCNLRYTGSVGGYVCEAQWFDGGKKGQCVLSGNECKPTGTPSSYPEVNPTLSDGVLGLSSSGSLPGSLGAGGGSTIVIGKAIPAGSADNSCDVMFSGSTFQYPSAKSVLLLSFTGSFQLADERWDCKMSLVNANPCGTVYDGMQFLLEGFFDVLNGTTAFVLRPIQSAVGYIGEPERGKKYCFFGSKWEYSGKPPTYIDYANGGGTKSTAGMTRFDDFILMVVSISVFIMIFRK